MEKEFAAEGKKVFYRVVGKGKPVMLVHGFGETADVWANQVAFFKDKFQLIVPDLPGSGQSELTDDLSMESMAETLKQIIDKEKIDRFILIGHSMGGYVTLAFAEKYPQYLEAFGLFHSTALPDSEEKKATRRKGIDFIRQRGAFAFLQNTSPNLFAPDTRETNQQLVNDFISKLNNFSPGALVSYYEAMMKRPDRTPVLKTVIPVLFIMGKYDTAIPLEDSLKLCPLPEKAYITILNQSGHMGMLEEPGKSNDALEEFLT